MISITFERDVFISRKFGRINNHLEISGNLESKQEKIKHVRN